MFEYVFTNTLPTDTWIYVHCYLIFITRKLRENGINSETVRLRNRFVTVTELLI